MALAATTHRPARKGRVLAVKWGYNPNSSSLGVDITFLLFGLSIVTLLTPLIGFLIRFYRAEQRLPSLSGPQPLTPGPEKAPTP
jgi:hypothetical protein